MKSRGYRIKLGAIETALHSHPDVLECVVVAVPDPLVTNRIVAFVAARNGLVEPDLVKVAAERVPHYMLPERIRLIDELPQDIDWKGGSIGAHIIGGGANDRRGIAVTEDLIRQYINDELAKDVLREPLRNDDLLLERQILDSLGLFELVGYLESEFDIEVRDEVLVPANFGSVRDIARLVREKQ